MDWEEGPTLLSPDMKPTDVTTPSVAAVQRCGGNSTHCTDFHCSAHSDLDVGQFEAQVETFRLFVVVPWLFLSLCGVATHDVLLGDQCHGVGWGG